MMQGLHHHQQQLAALLSVALPKDDSTSSTAPSDEDDSRLAAINSLHRAILYPHNSLLVTHSAAFLAQGFSQLLSDKSCAVRQAAVIAYGALCAVICSIPVTSNGRQNHVILASLVDRFIGWALPLLSNVGAVDGTKELALDGLREFLNVGDVVGSERYVLPILKACQLLFEDERTSLSLLHRLLGVITLISVKFSRCFQPHFPDIVDLLLGWALVPDLAESERRVIMDSFLQFQKHWVGSLAMSLRLLTKFLGDMEVLLQDGTPGTPPQFRRLLALLSCFSTILQSTASGLLEMNLLEQISEPLSTMLPHLLRCLSVVGQKFGWSEWIEDFWKCLTLLAEILCERFSNFYPLAVDILFQSLDLDATPRHAGYKKITSFQVHGVLRTNLQLLSLQKLGLLPSSVQKILQFDAPISQLRFHPNHLVTGSCAATYIFLLQHGNKEVVDEAVTSLIKELELLKAMLGKDTGHTNHCNSVTASRTFSKPELFSLIKFDLKVLLACVPSGVDSNLIGQTDIISMYSRRSEKLVSFTIEKLNPFEIPIQPYLELQVAVFKFLERLTTVELLIKCSARDQNFGKDFIEFPTKTESSDGHAALITGYLTKYSFLLIKGLQGSSPLAVKLTALHWGQKFCEIVMAINDISNANAYSYEPCEHANVVMNLVYSLLGATFDRELEVRSHAAITLEMFLQAKLLYSLCFYPLAEVILEKLGDPVVEIRDAYVRLLAHVLPTTVYACGLYDYGKFRHVNLSLGNASHLHWKQVFALKQLPLQLHSKQLVSILSYISQRWKVPLSSWIQRLIHSCRSSRDSIFSQTEDTGTVDASAIWLDVKVDEDILERICSVNSLAGAWWAVQEAARYCISTRLRTNLGGPAQTFAALERMLLDVAHLLQLDNEQNDGNLSMIGSSGAHLLPMRLLLDFVEALKKNVYNAYEGSVILPSATRQSSLFFRANKKVCEEWFSRICEPMMNAGLALHCNDAIIQYCTLRLQELKNLSMSALKEKSRAQVAENFQNSRGRYRGDVLKVLRHMSLALCRSFEPESLIGLQNWVSIAFSSLFGDDRQSFNDSATARPLSWITGLVYQARGQYESAAAHFTHLLQTEESLCSLGSDGVQFVIARIIESYTAVSDWKSLESWLLELQLLRSKHAGKSYSGALTMAGNEINAIHALARFDEGDYQSAWSCLDLTPKSSSELTLDPKIALQRSEQMLLQSLLFQKEGKSDKVILDLQKARSMLEEPLSILPLDGLAEATPLAIQLHCICLLEDDCKLKSTHEKAKQAQSILNSYIKLVPSSISMIRQDCSPWLKVLRVYQTMFSTSPVSLKLCMNLLNLARKQRNLLLANRLKNHLNDCIPTCPEERLRDLLSLNLQYEGILLLYAENKFEDAFTNLWSLLRPCMGSSEYKILDVDEKILRAKACLKLAKWLRQNYSDWSPNNMVINMPADFESTEISSVDNDGNDKNIRFKQSVGQVAEEIVGTATKLSTRICPAMGKSWISYASWCFTQARDSLHNNNEATLRSCSFPILIPEVSTERFKLSKDEVQQIKSLILHLLQDKGDVKCFKDEQYWKLWLDSEEQSNSDNPLTILVLQLVNIIETAAGAPGAENCGGESLSSTLSSRLKICLLNANLGLGESDVISTLDGLVNIWWSLRRRRVSLFGHAAYGYIQYLSYSSTQLCQNEMPVSDDESSRQKTGSYTLRATLYILHILLNYGVELKDTLESALMVVPLLPWQELTPQLFARISSHHEQVIRKHLEGLLIMLAKQSPCSIVYPTLVDVSAYEEKPSEELHHVLSCLRELYPRLVQDVQLMINELSNVTVLWEELWLSTLQDLHTDVMRRVNVLKEEAARIAENISLSQNEKNKINSARYSAMMAPIVVALERRLASTARKPETPHEAWFQEEYQEQLKSAILTFKTPPMSAAGLGDVWRPFDGIAASLASYQRKSTISLREVAPHLAQLSSSDVPMPGLEKQLKIPESDKTTDLQGVKIASFHEQVTILSTKTKPKKLVILGSDGQMYTYLLKGREDLRLDARIMQFLRAINGFLHSSSTQGNALGIRYYSVTPISGRAGLIQWVDNVISIYSVFKSWQSRVQLAQLTTAGAGNTKPSAPPPVPRPSDMFYGKIIPALKEKGIKRVISRRDWPHEVKRKVLLDLIKEVPRHLLHQELWCASEGYKAFSSKMNRYSGSVAAMSIVGHILGLGDRHLDNILIDFGSGSIVHIDYNVCFDKGQRLKVPEIVPFRLTQMIEAALGLTGIEGSFRANCETVIGILRKNKDILLMLLEVFVWDPLVEWTRGDFHDEAAIGGEERKGMELAVSLSLFASRVQEIRVPLQEHHDQLLTSLPAVESALERFTNVLNQYELASTLFHRADQERSNLTLHETSAKSIVAEATSNSEKIRASFEIQAREFAQAKALVTEKAHEATTWVEQHGRILDALQCNIIPEVNASYKLNNMEEALSLTAAVTVAGVPLTVVPEPTQAQCNDIDREVSQLVSELDDGLASAITALQAYSVALQRILPLNYLTTSAVHGWAQILQLSINALSSEILSLARRQASDLVVKFHGDSIDSIKFRHDDLCLKVDKYAVEIEKLEEERAELENSIGLDSESKAKDRILSAFMKFLQSSGLLRKEDGTSSAQSRHDGTNNARLPGDLEEKKEKALSILNISVSWLYNEVNNRVLHLYNEHNVLLNDSGAFFTEFEEQVERCNLVTEFVSDLWKIIGKDMPTVEFNKDKSKFPSESNWVSIFKTILSSCNGLISQMTEIVLPNVIRSAVSLHSEVMDAFGLISQVRGSIDTALEQLVEVEMERLSLVELEQNYFVKVGLITEQQLALEEAAVKGRDHLSWEEAEELASQEESCRAQLDQLHQTWNQRDLRTSSLIKREADIKNALVSVESRFQSLVFPEEQREPHILRREALLAALVKPFLQLESSDNTLYSADGSAITSSELHALADVINSGNPISEYVWKVSGLLGGHSFFMWKIGVIDSFLDACIRDVASSVEQNLGFDQSLNFLKKKLEIQVQKHVNQYLKERVAPSFLACLDKEIENLKQLTEATKETVLDELRRDGAAKRVLLMLEEYCNAHETARAAKSAASLMERQVNELKDSLRKTTLEIVQMEWMHDVSMSQSYNRRARFERHIDSTDSLNTIILNLSRPKLLECIQSSVSKITRSMDGLQSCERNSLVAEGQLERAMGWACAGPNTGTSGNSSNKSLGIPPEFHEHIKMRRQILWEFKEKASDIAKFCVSVLEFEASRDGCLLIPSQPYPFRTSNDGKTWQQAYLNALTRFDVTYHSYTRTEQEWKLAQSTVEAASSGLYAASNELCIASLKAKSASGDLQSTVLLMRDCAYEASVALTAFSRISRIHTALTSECGSMLEEVLAITEDIHDVYNLGKEAAAIHLSLMEDLSKANAILLPLESVLSKDVAAMTDAIARERETKKEISHIHGQAIYQSYCLRIREAYQTFKPLVPSLTSAVKGLCSMLTRLGRTASLHAGTLHKALEGIGESQEAESQDIALPRSDPAGGDTAEFDSKEGENLSQSDDGGNEDVIGFSQLSLEDKGWISPPDSIYCSSSGSGITSTEASFPDSLNDSTEIKELLSQNSNGRNPSDHVYSGPISHTDGEEISSSKLLEFKSMEPNANEEISNSASISHADGSALLFDKSLTTPSNTLNTLNEGVQKSEGGAEPVSSNKDKNDTEHHEALELNSSAKSRVGRGKNAYALSVLKRVEMKIDGRDISENREISIAEQVDYLLKQATSVDNLCNMYEGWTPWI